MLNASMRIKYKSVDEIRLQREACLAVAEIIDEICAEVAPGVSTWDLDQIAVKGIKRLGVTSAFLGYYDYPAVLCTSVNEVVVHGIPRKDVVLKDGDIIGIDFGVFKHGFCGDSARTVFVGDQAPPEVRKLVAVTRQALDLGIDQCVPGNRLGYHVFSAVELKTIQEVITLTVFCGFSVLYLGESLKWNHLAGFGLMGLAVYVIFKEW